MPKDFDDPQEDGADTESDPTMETRRESRSASDQDDGRSDAAPGGDEEHGEKALQEASERMLRRDRTSEDD